VLAKFHAGDSFAELARQFSQDTRRNKGGDWGWTKRSDMRKEFSDVLFALKKGEASEPIITARGLLPALRRGSQVRRHPGARRSAR
jgi:peptidyl-prolyl cis-trans isomerase SurA